jgi:hypothetical protein
MVTTSLTAQTRSSTHRPAATARWFGRQAKDQQGKSPGGNRDVQLLPATVAAAVLARWRVLQARVVQLRHRTGGGAAWHQPSRSPRQRPPAVTLMVRSFWDGAAPARPPDPPQPVQLRRQRPSALLQVPQVAAAVERPAVAAAGPAAPIAGLRGARMRVVRLRPARACAALTEPRAGRDDDLPGPAGLPAAHQVSPPLAWLPGSDQPTEQAGTAKPKPHRGSTVRPRGSSLPGRSGCGRRPEGATAVAPAEGSACNKPWAAMIGWAVIGPEGEQSHLVPGSASMMRHA